MKIHELANDMARDTYGVKQIKCLRGIRDVSTVSEIMTRHEPTGKDFVAVTRADGSVIDIDDYNHLKRFHYSDGSVTDIYGTVKALFEGADELSEEALWAAIEDRYQQ